MKNIKSITLGILIGVTATLSITALADYIVNPNPYPVKVNGQTVQVEGYNINDSTYFKLRDIAEAVGGFKVGFEDNAIIVNTPSQPTPAPTPIAKADLSPLPELPIERRNGIDYVNTADIEKLLKDLGLSQYKFGLHDFVNKDDLLNPILTDIPICENDIMLIPLEYYTSTVVPVINSLR